MRAASSEIRVGVIGLGQWGPNHVRIFRSIEGCTVARVADLSEERLASARRQFRDVATTRRPEEIVQAADIDAVVIATPVASHVALARAALEAGKDVLCEKPLSLSVADSVELAALARRLGRLLMVGHVFLYNPCVIHLANDLRERSLLGRIYYLDAVRTNLGPVRQDAGAIQDLASHDISIFNYLLDAMPLEVSATGGSFLQEGIEDFGFLSLRYPGGVVCHVHTSWLNPRKVRQLTLVGDARMAVWDDMNHLEPIRYYDKGVVADNYASFGEFQMILRDGAITIPKIKLYEPLLRQDQEFIDCIRSRQAPRASAEFALGVVRVLAAAQESLAARGRAVAIASP